MTVEVQGPALVVRRSHGLATASLVLGLVSVCLGWLPLVGLGLTFVPTVLAVVFGIVGISRSGRQGGRGLAVTGLVLGSVVFVLYFGGFGTFW